MDFKDQPFIPMLFGGDINTYSVARAFYEEYHLYKFNSLKNCKTGRTVEF